MKDPSRWLSPDGDAPPGARDLLRHGHAPQALDAASRAKHTAMMSKIAAGAVGTAATSTLATGAKFSFSAKLLAGVGILATATAVPLLRERARRAPPAAEHTLPIAAPHATAPSRRVAVPETPLAHAALPAPEAPPSPEVPSLVAQAPVAEPEITARPSPHAVGPSLARRVVIPVAAPTPSVEAPSTPVATEPAATPSLPAPTAAGLGGASPEAPRVVTEGEQMLGVLDLVNSDPNAALAQIDRLARQFPRSQQTAEREFLAVHALHNLHRDADARARGEALIAAHPQSPYVGRTRRFLGLP